MQMTDLLALDAVRRADDGALVAMVRAARTGIQDYAGYEVGRPDLPKVAVYRPEEEVFSRDSMRSFANAPVTIEHPANPVTIDNWKDHAVGDTGEDVVRDGEFVRVPLILRDAAAIDAVAAGKREISMGYSCELEFVDGVAPDGRTYQAIQRGIKVNHLAVVDRARGGPKLKLGDRRETTGPIDGGHIVATKTITFDGLPLEVTDAAEAAINKVLGQLRDAQTKLGAAETQVATLATDKSTLEAKVVTLEKAVTDAKLTPAQLRDAAKAYALTVDKAKGLGVAVTDSMDEAAIQRAVVDAKIGTAAKDWNDAQVAASFETLTASVRPADGVRTIIASGPTHSVNTANIRDAARAARVN